MDLFTHALNDRMKDEAPLAARMCPHTLDECIASNGFAREQIAGEGKLLRRAIEADRLFSSILLGGSLGTGKTTRHPPRGRSGIDPLVTRGSFLTQTEDSRSIEAIR